MLGPSGILVLKLSASTMLNSTLSALHAGRGRKYLRGLTEPRFL